jgi:hypothetical protein
LSDIGTEGTCGCNENTKTNASVTRNHGLSSKEEGKPEIEEAGRRLEVVAGA